MKMKSADRYELIKQFKEQGLNQSAMAKEMGCTPALVSQIIKKFERAANEPVVTEPEAA